MKSSLVVITASFLSLGSALLAASPDPERITLSKRTQVPGSTLAPGEYRFEVEDRLQDRAIVRITEANGGKHELVLAVPSSKVGKAKGLSFAAGSIADLQAAKSWNCKSCTTPLVFVYPKDEAVALTEVTGKPFMAVDPSYDKLPANLSQDDMKVVTLWLLSPKEVLASGRGSGVSPTKLADMRTASDLQSAPVGNKTAGTERASLDKPKIQMPHTAGHDSEFALAGVVLLAMSVLTAGLRSRMKHVQGAR